MGRAAKNLSGVVVHKEGPLAGAEHLPKVPPLGVAAPRRVHVGHGDAALVEKRLDLRRVSVAREHVHRPREPLGDLLQLGVDCMRALEWVGSACRVPYKAGGERAGVSCEQSQARRGGAAYRGWCTA